MQTWRRKDNIGKEDTNCRTIREVEKNDDTRGMNEGAQCRERKRTQTQIERQHTVNANTEVGERRRPKLALTEGRSRRRSVLNGGVRIDLGIWC